MPGFDRTGPKGQGSRTGREMGKCNPENKRPVDSTDDNENTGGFGNGPGRGKGFGNRFGRAMGRFGFGKGQGRISNSGSGRGRGRGQGRGDA